MVTEEEMENKYIAPFILKSEYVCKCCKKLPIDLFVEGEYPEIGTPFLMLFKYFQDIREAWGKAIPINSGYRCQKNNEPRGEKYSVHLFGLALDLDFKDKQEVSKAVLLINQIAPKLRMGIYKEKGTFIHIDTGYYIYPRIDEKWRKGARWYG